MALQLQRLGDRVETIVMFDSHPPSCYAGPIPSAEAYALVLPRLACRAMGIDLDTLPEGSQSWEGLQRHLMERAGLGAADWEGDDAGGFEQAWMHHHHALKRHRPTGTFLGDLVYFEAHEPQPEFISELNISVEAGIAEREWKRLCTGGFQHLRVPGDHYTLLSERNAPAIGDALLKAMSVSR
jgi:thioesterase domain-containing protein